MSLIKLIDHWATLPVYNRIPKRTIDVRDFLSFLNFAL